MNKWSGGYAVLCHGYKNTDINELFEPHRNYRGALILLE